MTAAIPSHPFGSSLTLSLAQELNMLHVHATVHWDKRSIFSLSNSDIQISFICANFIMLRHPLPWRCNKINSSGCSQRCVLEVLGDAVHHWPLFLTQLSFPASNKEEENRPLLFHFFVHLFTSFTPNEKINKTTVDCLAARQF